MNGRDNFTSGRADVSERIKRHAVNGSGGVIVAAAPGSGCTTLLRNVADQIFDESADTIPVYFSTEATDESAANSAKRFAHGFLSQVVGFRRCDKNLAGSGLSKAEIVSLSTPQDIAWIERAIERVSQTESAEPAFLERCLSIPLLASLAGLRPFIIFDGLHNLQVIEGGEQYFAAIKQAASIYNFPFVLAGRRRFVSAIGAIERIDIDQLSVKTASELAGIIAAQHAVKIDDAARDLIAIQLNGRPDFIESIINRAAVDKISLDGFPAVERAYAEELFAGRIGRHFDQLFDTLMSRETQTKLVALLADSIDADPKLVPLPSWQRVLGMDASEIGKMLENLNVAEIVRVTSNRVEPMREDNVLSDYLQIRHRLETLGEDRAAVYAESVAAYVRRAPQLMAAHYRANSAIGLRDILANFDGREVPLGLLDYALFKEHYKGLSEAEISTKLATVSKTVKLPAAVFAAHTEAFYPPITGSIERERSAVAAGFQAGIYTPEDEIYWLAAEIESKIEAASELAEFWCDRLETVAMACGFRNYRLWLIAPDGFDAEAGEVLSQRNAYGSSRAQATLLAAMLDEEKPAADSGIEYEIAIPMGGETELIAAHTLEEIAKRHGFRSHDINQLKTALVEACINAAEHSHSPDGRTSLKFTVSDNAIIITVANRGLRITDTPLQAEVSTRRGWGLKLIEKLMDEVRIEQTDDGTRISMTKILLKPDTIQTA